MKQIYKGKVLSSVTAINDTISSKIATYSSEKVDSLIDNTYTHGNIRFIGGRSITSVDIKSSYDTYDDYVDEVFHRQLKECENKESEYSHRKRLRNCIILCIL